MVIHEVRYCSLAYPSCPWSFVFDSVNKKMSFRYEIYTAKLTVPTVGLKCCWFILISANSKEIRILPLSGFLLQKGFLFDLCCSQYPSDKIVSPPTFWIYFHTKPRPKIISLNLFPNPNPYPNYMMIIRNCTFLSPLYDTLCFFNSK